MDVDPSYTELKDLLEKQTNAVIEALGCLACGADALTHNAGWARPRGMTKQQVQDACQQAYHWFHKALGKEAPEPYNGAKSAAELLDHLNKSLDGNRPLPFDREELGKIVVSGLFKFGWETMPDSLKENFMDIAERVARMTLVADAAQRSLEIWPK